MNIRGTFGKRIRRKIGTTLQRSARKAETAAQSAATAAQTAKQGLDQVLLGLQHNLQQSKFSQVDPQDMVQKVGRKVLERAEGLRAQLAETPFSPAWLKGVSLVPRSWHSASSSAGGATSVQTSSPIPTTTTVEDQSALVAESHDSGLSAEVAASVTEASVSDPALAMQPETLIEIEVNKALKKAAARIKPVQAQQAPTQATFDLSGLPGPKGKAKAEKKAKSKAGGKSGKSASKVESKSANGGKNLVKKK